MGDSRRDVDRAVFRSPMTHRDVRNWLCALQPVVDRTGFAIEAAARPVSPSAVSNTPLPASRGIKRGFQGREVGFVSFGLIDQPSSLPRCRWTRSLRDRRQSSDPTDAGLKLTYPLIVSHAIPRLLA